MSETVEELREDIYRRINALEDDEAILVFKDQCGTGLGFVSRTYILEKPVQDFLGEGNSDLLLLNMAHVAAKKRWRERGGERENGVGPRLVHEERQRRDR